MLVSSVCTIYPSWHIAASTFSFFPLELLLLFTGNVFPIVTTILDSFTVLIVLLIAFLVIVVVETVRTQGAGRVGTEGICNRNEKAIQSQSFQHYLTHYTYAHYRCDRCIFG